MTLKSAIYPEAGSTKARNLSAIKNLMEDFNKSLTKYLSDQDVKETQGIKLPGLVDAHKTALEYGKRLDGKNDLAVRGGIDEKGHLVIEINGILPGKKGPEKVAEHLVVRKDFADLLKTLQDEQNVVVNLQPGDKVIDRAASNQGKKFNTPVVEKDDADFSGITTGTVILAAHGSRVEVSGRTLGTKLGKKTPNEILELLTENTDPKKNLSPAFKGTVLLSGCFTAAGGIAPPGEDYDYDTFAGKVWTLLKNKGFKQIQVQGMPGQARTDAEGNKSSVTPTGQKTYDALKRVVQELDSLKTKHLNEPDAMKADPKYIASLAIITKLRKDANDEKEQNVIKGLINRYGLTIR